MEKSHCQIRSSQKQSISCIDWDEIDEICKPCDNELPDNAITIARLMDRYDIAQSTAGGKFRDLLASGKYRLGTYKVNKRQAKYLVREG